MAATIVETAPLVLNVGVVLLAAATMGFIARKFGLPAVFGYILTGLLVSPFTPGFVADNNQLALLADIGVVLLLFEVGIEIDLKRMSKENRSILWGAPAQVAIGVLIGTPVFLLLDMPIFGALLLSLSIAISSSVAVVQDIIGVSAAVIILTVFGESEKPLPIAIGGLFGFILLAFACSKLLPKLLRMVRWEKDLFLIYSVSVGLVLAALGTVVFGIPMALAAFIAGLSINQSQDTDEVRKAILPFRDLFAVLFFVVIGTLIQPSNLSQAWPFALTFLLLLVFSKTIPTALLVRLGKLEVQKIQFGVGISQIGEFSFVLGSIAFAQKAITESQYTGLLVAVVISIVASSLLVRKVGSKPTDKN
jgi:CPA2 family monovalent cation:H+ antiporter-2